MFINKHIMCTLCLKYAPDCNLDNKQEILNLISAVTIVEFQCDFAFHVCAKCLISLKAAYRIQQKFVRAIQFFISLPEHEKVEYVTSNLSEVIDLSPTKECLICQRVVSAENMEQHLKRHFETKLTCDICNITVSNIGEYRRHCKSAKHAEVNFYCLECDVTFLYKSLYNIHIKGHQNSREFNEPIQINFIRESDCVQELAEEVNFKADNENNCLQEQPIIESEKRGNGLSIIKEALIKKSNNIGNRDSKIETRRTYGLKKYKIHKDNDREQSKIIKPNDEMKHNCVECNAKFDKKASYMIHLKGHVDKGDIDIYLLELIKNEIYGTKYKPKKPLETKSKKKTVNKVPKIEMKKSYELRKYKTHEENEKKETKIDEPEEEEEEIKYMCVECSATLKTKSSYMVHLKRHFNKGEIDIYLVELIRNEIYGPNHKSPGTRHTVSKRKQIGQKKKKSKYGPQKVIPKNQDNEVIEIILKEDPKILTKPKVVKNSNENGETKKKRRKKRKRLEGKPKQSKYVTLVTKIKRIFKGKETIYRRVKVVPKADLKKMKEERVELEKMKEEKAKLRAELAQKDKLKRTIWDVMNGETCPEEPPPKLEKVKCPDCPVVMDMNLHSCPNRMVLCDYCGLVLAGKNCRRHFLSRHSKGNIFKCTICGQLCSNQIQFYHHKKKHRPKQDYVCPYCGKNFPRSMTMRVHERQHTNEAPYKCDICGEAFKQNVLLRRHRSSVHKLFETLVCACDKCGKEFSSRIALKSHIHRVHSDTENKKRS